MVEIPDNLTPYFAWDRTITAGEIRRRLGSGITRDNRALASWLLREASFDDVWQFVSPRAVAEALPLLVSSLGRKKDFWIYIIRMWHELGKL